MIFEFRNGETGHYPVCTIAYHDGSPTADNVGYRAKTLNVEPPCHTRNIRTLAPFRAIWVGLTVLGHTGHQGPHL